LEKCTKQLDFFCTEPVHRSLDVKQYLIWHNVTTVENPPYMFSRLIALLFPISAKEVLKDSVAREYEMTENATKVLKDLSGNDFQ